ncbi:hypothetical protein RQP53_03610 [Paucibacter sp. APW11]|uniref:Uncharacterized protein n=1 Tax=Roseateles aquae TaxID=3077235 RepID=A0ABU3P712_9BURK|nr:hypothetical protein [Paucibacter sp. APW11]MDT8998360.1 hypothetical protein [Paucibacter sp. APW11]
MLNKFPNEFRAAGVRAVNAVAFIAREAEQKEMRAVFDRVTPYITGSVWVGAANSSKPFATLYLQSLGGKGVDPNSVLRAEIDGGKRRPKRFERALQRIGVLPPGWVAVPGAKAPRDGFGGVPGPFIVQLLSYLQAFGEQGYRANMTQKRKDQLSGRGRWINGRFVPVSQIKAKGLQRQGALAVRKGGAEYFVSHGKGNRSSARFRNGREQHLPAGIWRRSGLHGSIVEPMFLFVPAATYRPRYDFYGVADRTVRAELPRQMDAEVERRFAGAKA